ncbi:MAG: PHP domain-containing protein, partial [Deltaproteobacteria bacterium]|nr:PHP domain-containing protein [Deltaproteobacteria bacterium]
MARMSSTWLVHAVVSSVFWPVFFASLLGGCEQTCLDEDGHCTVSTPCEALAFTCPSPTATVFTLGVGDPVVGGVDALAAPGDVVLSNGVISAVIDALDHPHYVAPTGGQLLDLVSASGDNDSLTHLFHAVGLLPGDSFHYERMTTTQGEGYAAVQVHGRLDGYDDVRVVTRYEIRPCEPGIRVRTEIQNRAVETRIWALVDAWYWSGREVIPFSPGVGRGFEQPGIVDTVEDSWEQQPFMLAGSHGERPATYLEVACNEEELYGFHSDQISAVGTEPRIVQPRSYEIFERFIGVTEGSALGPASDVALELRRQLHDEQYAVVRGQVDGRALGDEVRASVEISQGTGAMAAEDRAAFTQVVPGADGSFSARVPRGHTYHAQLFNFGRPGDSAEVTVGSAATEAEFGTLTAEDPAELELSVLLEGSADFAQVFVRPADEETRQSVSARLFGSFSSTPACAPLLGAPQGGSPACDRVLVRDTVTVLLPAGSYDLFATAGLFATVAQETVTLAPGETRAVELSLSRLDIAPAGTLGADFHVHGGASFDSTVPDFDRVQAFLAANVDVIAATDHDAVWDYADARAALSADDRIQVMVGLETTGHILFDLTPGEDIPQVIGHWNVWPMPFDAAGPYRGAPWDELVEPGALFDRFVQAGWPEESGVIQLNHPWSEAQFGRDLGFPRA